MLQIIVFSFNRALQLDTLLTSFFEHWKVVACQVDVIYNTSNNEFQQGYDLLIEKMKSKNSVSFYKESSNCCSYSLKELVVPGNIKHILQYQYIRSPKSNFRPLLLDVIKNNKSNEVMFMTDDAMFIRDIYMSDEIFRWIQSNPFYNQFSLRLGNEMFVFPNCIEETNNYLEWNFSKMPINTNWGYRFSVDSHIYSKKLILAYFNRYIFVNPNSLEGYIESRMRLFGKAIYGRSFKDAKLLSFPINMVQNISLNESLGVDCVLLNKKYLDGYTMKYPVPDVISHFQVYPEYLSLFKDGIEEMISTK